MKPDLTQAFLKECFDYDPDTGILTWKARPRHHFATSAAHKRHNNRFAGEHAGDHNAHDYRHTSIKSQTFDLHRLIWLLMTGHHPVIIDHIDGNRSNNRWSNLRNTTPRGNNQNTRRRPATSGHVGVSFDDKRRKWRAHINVYRQDIHLGYFDTIKPAIAARQAAELHYRPTDATVAQATDAPVVRAKPYRLPHPAQLDLFETIDN